MPRGPALAAGLQFGPFRIDTAAAALLRDGRPVALRPQCYDLLVYLAARPGQVVGKDELLQRLWPRVVVTDDALTRTVSDLRDALGDAGRPAIRTVHRRGYMFQWLPAGTAPAPAPDPAAAATPHPPPAPAGDQARPIGRERPGAELEQLVGGAPRVVTLVGPGGVGKSHLARWAVQSLAVRFAHGAVVVDLAPLDDATLVADRVLAAFGLSRTGSGGLADIVRAIRPLQALLLLDNAEHLVDGVAALAATLAAGAPRLQLLVTSQRPLHLADEQVLRLAPLAVPPPGRAGPGEAPSAALALLHLRLRQLGSPAATGDEAPLAEICRRTDGLPLAIELAAARIVQFGAARVLALLDEGLDILDQGRRDAPLRHRSVRNAVLWSVGLLAAAERRVLACAGVFVGGFTLDAARHVLVDGQLDDLQVLGHLGSLVDASLIAHDAASGRFGMLDTVQRVARELLDAEPDADAVRGRHLQFHRARFGGVPDAMAALAEPFDTWRARLVADADNARAACRWAAHGGAGVDAVALAADLALVMGGEWPLERRRVLDQAAALAEAGLPAAVQASWLLARAQSEAATQPLLAQGWAAAAAAAFEAQGQRVGAFLALCVRAVCPAVHPDDGDGSADQADTVRRLAALHDPAWSAAVRAEGANAIACWHSARGDFQRCIDWRRRTLELFTRAGRAWRAHAAMSNLVDTLLASGDTAGAVEVGTRLLQALDGTRMLSDLPGARLNLLAAYLHAGDPARAQALVAEGWDQGQALGWQAYWADHLALLAALQGRQADAARLLGYADAQYRRLGAEREVNEARSAERAAGLAGPVLGPARLAELRRDGASLDDAAVGELVRCDRA